MKEKEENKHCKIQFKYEKRKTPKPWEPNSVVIREMKRVQIEKINERDLIQDKIKQGESPAEVHRLC